MARGVSPEVAPPRFLEPQSSCAPCIQSLDELDWVAQSAFRVGPWALGVRSSSAELDAALREILAAVVVDADAPANFSALLADESGADPQARAFNFLYRASDSVVRTRAPGRLVRTLLQYLSDLDEPPLATVRLAATAFVHEGRAIVAPPEVRDELSGVQTRLNLAGVQIVDTPWVHLDPTSHRLVVPEPSVAVDADALAEFERRHPAARPELPAVPNGTYPIAGWAFTTDPERVGPLRAAQGVAAAAQAVVNADQLGAQPTLAVLAAAIGDRPVAGIWWADPAALARALVDLAKGA